MWLTIENLPYLSLGWIGIGFLLVIAGVIALAHQQANDDEYVKYDGAEEMFSFFLQEEEKKNDLLREQIEEKRENVKPKTRNTKDTDLYEEIIKCYESNMPMEEIAKQMKIGIGEVKLIISLYCMR